MGKDGDELDPDLAKDYTNAGDVLRDLRNDDSLSKAEKAQAEKALSAWGRVPAEEQAKLEKLLSEVRGGLGRLRRPVKPRRNSFWHEEEEDSDLISSEIGEDDFEEDDILSMGHGKLEEHREFREYARLAVWEMPLLASQSHKPRVRSGRSRTEKLTGYGCRVCEEVRTSGAE